MIFKNKITNSYPSIIHSPDESELWMEITKNFFKFKKYKKNVKSNKKATIISWCNQEENILKKSSLIIGEKINFYGAFDNPWYNLNKFKYNLYSFDEFDTPYFIGLDALDVILIEDLNTIIEKFEKMSCDLLFNCESVFYPPFYEFNYYLENKKFQDDISQSYFKYLNSGAWIGKKEFCKKFFYDCSNVKIDDFLNCDKIIKLKNCDQSIVHNIFKKYYPKVKLDYENKIFSNISRCKINDFEINNMIKIL